MDLETLVIETLVRCRKLGMANLQADIEDPEVIESYVVVLEANGIDAEVLRASLPNLYSEEFFPRPGTIVKHCEPILVRRREERRQRTLIDAIDEHGRVLVAHPDRVQDGRLLPEGDRSGNGVPAARPLLPPRLSDGGLAPVPEPQAETAEAFQRLLNGRVVKRIPD